MSLLHYEDFHVGDVDEYGDRLVTADEIVDFAREFDPQPFHVDALAAENSQAGGLIASGWHTAAILMRMNCDAFMLRSASEGAPGCEEVSWLKPVRPGDRLHVRRTIVSARRSGSRPALGILAFLFEVFNQHGDLVMKQRNSLFVRLRSPETAPS